MFDTAIIVDGYAYQLEEHLQRFQSSAQLAGLSLPTNIEQLARIILETAAASKQVNGTLGLSSHLLLPSSLSQQPCSSLHYGQLALDASCIPPRA